MHAPKNTLQFDGLPRGHYGAILADPPWHFEAWASPTVNGVECHGIPPPGMKKNYGSGRLAASHYDTMKEAEISALPVGELVAPDSVLFMWTCWPTIEQAFRILDAWGFKFKTCGFCWIKANATQLELFQEDIEADMLLGYWTRSNSEICLLATRGKPKRLNADVRQAIIAPRRQHSRKPDGIHDRIERLVAGPYLELFARQRRPGWDCWGNEVDKFTSPTEWADMWSKPFDFSQEPKGNPG